MKKSTSVNLSALTQAELSTELAATSRQLLQLNRLSQPLTRAVACHRASEMHYRLGLAEATDAKYATRLERALKLIDEAICLTLGACTPRLSADYMLIRMKILEELGCHAEARAAYETLTGYVATYPHLSLRLKSPPPTPQKTAV